MIISRQHFSWLLFVLGMLQQPGPVKAQSGLVDTAFNRPDTAAYIFPGVNAILYQPDGRIVIGGGWGPTERGMIGRYLRNGSYDSSFSMGTGFNGPVRALALQPDGRIITGGYFSKYNSAPCEPLVRLLPDGRPDTSFQPQPGLLDGVSTIILQPNGSMIVRSYLNIFRLHADGSRDTSFSFESWRINSFTSKVLAQQADGKLLVPVGYHDEILRFNTNGSVEGSFTAANIGYGSVRFIIPLPDGHIIAGSYFVKSLVRLHANGKPDSSYMPPDLGLSGIASTVLQPDGKLIVGGDFEQGVLRLNTDGSLDSSYNTGITPPAGSSGFFTDNAPQVLCLQADTQLIVGGFYYATDKYVRINVLRLKQDGILDSDFRIGSSVNGTVSAVAVQKDKKIIVAGTFDSYYGIPRYNILRLDEDGALDSTFAPRLNLVVYDMALQPNGKIIIVGEFDRCMARLNADGSIDTSFHAGVFVTASPSTQSPVLRRVILQADGKIVVGGWFASYNGSLHRNVVRLNSDGSEDTGFRLSTQYWHTLSFQQADGKLVLNYADGQGGEGIICVDSNGRPDAGFNFQCKQGWWIAQAFPQPDGKMLVGLMSNDTNNTELSKLIRLLPDGTEDKSFHPQVSGIYFWAGYPGIFAVQPDGKMLYYATDTSIGRLTKDGLADNTFFQSNAYTLNIMCAAFQPDGKIILGGRQGGRDQYQSPFYKVPVKNGLYRLQNCMVVVRQRMPVSGTAGTLYERNIYWSKPDSGVTLSLLRGALPPGLKLNTQTGVLSGIPVTAGTYSFILAATNGKCSDSLSYSLVIDSAKTNNIPDEFTVYPIPTDDFIHIKFGNAPNGDYDIRLSDLTGRVLLRGTVNVESNHVEAAYDMRQFAAGIYFLTITGGQGRKIHKIEIL